MQNRSFENTNLFIDGIIDSNDALSEFHRGTLNPNQLTISKCQFTNGMLETFAGYLTTDKRFKSIIYFPYELSAEKEVCLVTAILKNPTPIYADLHLSNCTANELPSIFTHIKNNNVLTTLSIEFQYMNDELAATFASSVKNHISIKYLEITINKKSNLTDTALCHIIRLLEDNKKLEHFSLHFCTFTEESAKTLIHCFRNNHSLVSLSLGSTFIDYNVGSYTISNIHLCDSIRQVTLHNYGSTNHSVEIANMIYKIKWLVKLNIDMNNLDDEGAVVIADAIIKHPSLTSVSANLNPKIREKGYTALSSACNRNVGIIQISMFAPIKNQNLPWRNVKTITEHKKANCCKLMLR